VISSKFGAWFHHVIFVCAQVIWPAYIKLDEAEVTFTNNFLDCQATIVLGPSDEQVLAKRFDKSFGPRAAKIQDPDGTYLKSMADRHFETVMKEREAAAKNAGVATDDLVDALDGNRKKRKKEHALKALAKRAPSRKAQSLGKVIVA